jgi:hypothetical protein
MLQGTPEAAARSPAVYRRWCWAPDSSFLPRRGRPRPRRAAPTGSTRSSTTANSARGSARAVLGGFTPLSAHARDAFSPANDRHVTEIAACLSDVEGEVLADHSQNLTCDQRLGANTKQTPNTFHNSGHAPGDAEGGASFYGRNAARAEKVAQHLFERAVDARPSHNRLPRPGLFPQPRSNILRRCRRG